MHDNRPIGVFDSGVGGLTVYAALKRVLPNEQFIYFGDSARTPYGIKSSATVERYTLQCVDFLKEHEIKLLVLACNTATACALDALSASCSFPIVGVIEPAVKSAQALCPSGRLAVIGTEATINSGRFQELFLADNLSTRQVFYQAAPLFVPLVENGMFSGEIVDLVVKLYLEKLREQSIDTLVLGCTHYPVLADALQTFMGEHVRLVDCGQALAEQIVRDITERQMAAQSMAREDLFFVTDELPRFNRLARHILEVDTLKVNLAHLLENS